MRKFERNSYALRKAKKRMPSRSKKGIESVVLKLNSRKRPKFRKFNQYVITPMYCPGRTDYKYGLGSNLEIDDPIEN